MVDMHSAHGQEVLRHADDMTFGEVADYVFAQHRPRPPKNCQTGNTLRQRYLPTALAVAGGVNSADHARTFADLADRLRTKVGKFLKRTA